MGKYYDDDEREADYQSWVYYRESSHEDRESRLAQVQPVEKRTNNIPEAELQQSQSVNVFRDYPDHQAQIKAAEEKYFATKALARNFENDLDSK